MEKNYKLLFANSSLLSTYRAFTSLYLVAFALTMGASNTAIGFLGALPWLTQMITQIPGAVLCQKYLRKNLHVLFGTLSRLFWLPLLSVPFLFDHPIIALVVFYFLITLFEGTSMPAIISLIGDAVDEKDRGWFNATRIRLIGLFGVIAMTLGGLWLQQFPRESPIGFAIMFAFGALFGLASAIVIRKIEEPEYQDHVHHTVKEFFTIEGEFKRFVLFSVFFNFAWMFASPLFSVFFLKNLVMSYEFYGIIAALPILGRVIFSPRIGKLADKFGDKPVTILATIGIGLIPLLFMFVTPAIIWVVIPLQLFSGMVWAAFEITQFNLMIGLTDPGKRALQIAEHNFYSDIPLIVAPILGGLMSDNITWIISGIPLVFLISGVMRIASAVLLLKVKEPRVKGDHTVIEVLKEVVELHPIKGIVHKAHAIKRVTGSLFK